MKYAFMSFSTPTLSLADTLRLAQDLGYAGIEPRVARDHAHAIELERTPRERKEIVDLVSDSGIEICCLALSTQYVQTTPSLLEETRRYIELASDVGCKRLRIFGGALPDGMDRDRATEIVIEGLSHSAADAQSAGVTLCLETHDAWTHPDHVAAVLRQVDHPNVAVNWDIMHPVRTSHVSMQESFQVLRPWIRHVHVHDGTLSDPLVLKPCGEGEIDIRTALACLLEIQYSGYISGEWIGDKPRIDPADEIARLIAMESDLSKEVQPHVLST